MERLKQIADDFDKIHASSQKSMDDWLLKDSAVWAGETFGPDSLGTKAFGILPVAAWTLYTFSAGMGKGLVDVLRLGEGIKSGSASGVLQDAVRVANLLPVVGLAAKGVGLIGEAGNVAWATQSAGGAYEMSCGATSSTIAVRLSGARRLLTLEKFGEWLGKGSPKSPTFPGLTITEMMDGLNKAGATYKEVKMAGQPLQAVEVVAAQGRGPVIFGVKWLQGTGAVSSNAAVEWNEANHALVAFRNTRGAVVVADQFGVRPIAELGKINGVVSPFQATSRALAFENLAFTKSVMQLRATGSLMTGVANPVLRNWLTLSVGIETVIIPEVSAWNLDAAIREKLGLPPRGAAPPQSTEPSSAVLPNVPNTVGTPAPSERTLIWSLLPTPGSKRFADDIYSLLIKNGYTSGRVGAVLEEMEKNGEVLLVRGKNGSIATGSVIRIR